MEEQTQLQTILQNTTVGDIPELSEGDILLHWKTKEYEPPSLDQRQVFWGVLLSIALMIWAIATANFLFAIIIVLFIVVVYLFLNREPRELDVAITPKGIIYGETFLSYTQDLSRFWILYDPPSLKSLYLAQTSVLRPTLVIDLGIQDPIQVRELLLDYLDEDLEADEHIADKWSRRIGF